eukprot:TRINITY_DN11662_c0_g1_i2.p1 TRINITY_DN11662_c0_g1~~TRINITY_DN11662_c0_g1_i2.p1  ORF type:complete len:674 (-),score=117.00 TRINITY_DN11662_c0_g1_i2:389-2410(-)
MGAQQSCCTEGDARAGAAESVNPMDERIGACMDEKMGVLFQRQHSICRWQAMQRSESARRRNKSLPTQVALAGGVDAWNNSDSQHSALIAMVRGMVTAKTVDEALTQVESMIDLGHLLWANTYLRMLQCVDMDLYYGVMETKPSLLLPVMYTPTVGEVCQKFGQLPFYRRGCYLSLADRGNLKAVLQEYADIELMKDANGRPICDCIVFSDGGRILGLGDLGAWGMGIPIGKLDLYTVCGGVDPHRVIPVILDVGCGDESKNTAHLTIRDHPRYTGLKQDRVLHKSEAGTMVNSCYYGKDSMIMEFMKAATDLFGEACLLQFEDFNSNDAFPLLEEYREQFLCYNDDIQGTAAVAVAAILGAVRLKNPDCKDLIAALDDETYLFHGAGSANVGTAQLLLKAGVSKFRIFVTGSKGLIWRSADGKDGCFKNNEQKDLAVVGKPKFDSSSLVEVIKNCKPTVTVGAVGVSPNCFTKEVIDACVVAAGAQRPIVFALSNPKSQAEITASNFYKWTNGHGIFASGTYFDPVMHAGTLHCPGQANNVYIFPGMSYGAIKCQAQTLPDRLFVAAAEAVASSLSQDDMAAHRVVPDRDRIREVSLNVATSVVIEAQKLGLARVHVGDTHEAVKKSLQDQMWHPAALRKTLTHQAKEGALPRLLQSSQQSRRAAPEATKAG